MEMRNENIVNLIEQLIDLKVRQALLVRDLSNATTYRQSELDTEAMQKVKRLLVNLLDR
jgi:hypothetical protein